MGTDIAIYNSTLSIPQAKLQEILEECFKTFEVDNKQTLFLDASLTGLGGGGGGGWRNHIYATPVRGIPNFQLTIVHLEMLNVI